MSSTISEAARRLAVSKSECQTRSRSRSRSSDSSLHSRSSRSISPLTKSCSSKKEEVEEIRPRSSSSSSLSSRGSLPSISILARPAATILQSRSNPPTDHVISKDSPLRSRPLQRSKASSEASLVSGPSPASKSRPKPQFLPRTPSPVRDAAASSNQIKSKNCPNDLLNNSRISSDGSNCSPVRTRSRSMSLSTPRSISPVAGRVTRSRGSSSSSSSETPSASSTKTVSYTHLTLPTTPYV